MGISHGNPLLEAFGFAPTAFIHCGRPAVAARCYGYWQLVAHITGTPFYDRFTEAAAAEAQATLSTGRALNARRPLARR